jgi:Carboxypeptidase regulatory-like domain
MPHWLKLTLIVVVFLLLASYPLAKQFETGAIEGIVTDDRGPVAMVSVQVRNLMTSVDAHAQTDMTGYYRIGNLWNGDYSIWVQAAGHDSVWFPRKSVGRGQTVRFDIHLNAVHTITSRR